MSSSDHTQSGASHRNTGYAEALSSAVVFDRTAAGRLRVRGADRATWLQGLLTNDVVALQPGQGCYAAFLTAQGRMISDVRVLAFEESLLLDVPHSRRDALASRLDQFIITEDVVLEDETPSTARFGVYGPAAARLLADVLESVGPEDRDVDWVNTLDSLPEHGHLAMASGHGPLVVARAWELGMSGFDVYCQAASHHAVWTAVTSSAILPASVDVWETLRIEAGVPAFGVDMDEDTIPLEAGIESRAISQTKGCYIGQEVIVRILHRGHGRVARKLVGLMADVQAEAAPPLVAGAAVLADGSSARGRVTSAAYSPRLNRWLALGYVQRDLAAPDTRLRVETEIQSVPVRVASLPFV